MNYLKNLNLLYILSLIGCCYANIADYLKGTDRTFNVIEGKVIEVKIFMDEEKYQKMIDTAQLSSFEFNVVNHGIIPEELNFETKVNVNMTLDKEHYHFEKVKFKTAGHYGRTFAKLGFNLKLKNETFYGIKNFRLRPDYYDLSHFRSKLVTDLMNKWEIPTIQETFCKLYINDNFYGFYLFMDSIKSYWIKQHYNIPEDEEVKTLYNCGNTNGNFSPETVKDCKNENDDFLGYNQPIIDVVNKIYNTTSVRKLEKYFDVDNFRKVMIVEYLISSFDHFLIGGHNYQLYQQPNGKWQIFLHDFDIIFLSQIEKMIKEKLPLNIPEHDTIDEYAAVKFDEWFVQGNRKPFVDAIYFNDKKKFRKVLKEMLITGFNPDELFPRIDELAKFVAPYVKEDFTPDKDGNFPGVINKLGEYAEYNMDMFWDNVEYGNHNYNLGLKHFIQLKFDSVCKNYGFNKKEILREAALYRKKRDLKIKINEIKQEIKLKKQEIHHLVGKQLKEIKKNIEKLTKKLSNLKKQYNKL